MNATNRIASLLAIIAKAQNFLTSMTKHRQRLGSEVHAHVTYGYQWPTCWGEALVNTTKELSAVLKGIQEYPLNSPVADEWAYRKWNEHALRWSDEKDCKRYTAYYNGVKVGSISYKLADLAKDGNPYWNGYSCWFMDGRLAKYPDSPELGKQLIEAMFSEFICRAAGDFGLDSENAEASRPAAANPETLQS